MDHIKNPLENHWYNGWNAVGVYVAPSSIDLTYLEHAWQMTIDGKRDEVRTIGDVGEVHGDNWNSGKGIQHMKTERHEQQRAVVKEVWGNVPFPYIHNRQAIPWPHSSHIDVEATAKVVVDPGDYPPSNEIRKWINRLGYTTETPFSQHRAGETDDVVIWVIGDYQTNLHTTHRDSSGVFQPGIKQTPELLDAHPWVNDAYLATNPVDFTEYFNPDTWYTLFDDSTFLDGRRYVKRMSNTNANGFALWGLKHLIGLAPQRGVGLSHYGLPPEIESNYLLNYGGNQWETHASSFDAEYGKIHANWISYREEGSADNLDEDSDQLSTIPYWDPASALRNACDQSFHEWVSQEHTHVTLTPTDFNQSH